MSRIYAKREDTSERILIALECDHCDATIKPHKEISDSGWMKKYFSYTPGDWSTQYSCSECWGREQ